MAEEEKLTESTTQSGEPSFEEAMKELETIVRKLEENEVALEEAINLFQKGMQLSKISHQKLQKVEQQMDQILQEDGTFQPFKIQEDENG